jgi:tetratricopeptide (TPR) repeat protein
MLAPDKPHRRLESWKEIAGYLGRTVRTVQRWEASEGLPVHRQLHQSLGNVYAFPEELDQWTAQRQEEPSAGVPVQPKSRRWLLPAVFAAVLIVASGAWLIARSLQPHEPTPQPVKLARGTFTERRPTSSAITAPNPSTAGVKTIAGLLEVHGGGAIVAPSGSVVARPPSTNPNVAMVWLLVTALDNRTGEPLLDESVPFLLEREISNSSRVYVAPRVRIEDSLKLMRKDPNTRVDEALGREVAIRDGGIRLVVSSRAERAGSAYLMTASVIDAASGRLIGGASEQARTLEDIAPAVRRLASAIQQAAGDRTAGSAANQPGLEHVTTPSLRACQLYSQAYLLATKMPNDWATAEPLTREAIAEDPQFASAHLWLAWALRNQHKSEPERRASLARAVALSNLATDRERQFILASEKHMQPDDEAAVALYHRMLASYPDDYWARNNLVWALNRLGRKAEFAAESYRLADLRPNDPLALNRGIDQAMLDGKLQEARRYRDRLDAIGQSNPDLIAPGIRRRIRVSVENFPLHEFWVAGKLEQMQAEIRRRVLAHPHPDGPDRVWSIASFYRTLGQLREAEHYVGEAGFATEKGLLVGIAYLRDDPGALEAQVRDISPLQGSAALWLVQRDITPGQLEDFVAGTPALKPLFEARVAALKGDCLTAARKSEDYFRMLGPVAMIQPDPMIARALLARTYELAGDDAAALRSLQAADDGPASRYFVGIRSYGDFWHRIRYDEARVLRKLGRQRDAEAVEAGLRRDLRLADPDHPILVRLKESGRRPFNVY